MNLDDHMLGNAMVRIGELRKAHARLRYERKMRRINPLWGKGRSIYGMYVTHPLGQRIEMTINWATQPLDPDFSTERLKGFGEI